MVCVGAMPYRRDFPATTRILSFQAENCMILSTILFLAWLPYAVMLQSQKRVESNFDDTRAVVQQMNLDISTVKKGVDVAEIKTEMAEVSIQKPCIFTGEKCP